MVNELARELLGLSATAQPMERKLQALIQKLRREAHLLVWDNLESATGIPGTEVQPQLPQEDLELLAGLLKDLQDGNTKALLTSRKKETNWLSLLICFRVPLGGLEGEELWEYCNAVVRYLGLTLDRDNMTYRRILEKLCGNPLAIRAILLRLQDRTPEDLLRGLDRAFEGAGGGTAPAASRRPTPSSGESLKSRFLPVLQVTGLHEYYADADLVERCWPQRRNRYHRRRQSPALKFWKTPASAPMWGQCLPAPSCPAGLFAAAITRSEGDARRICEHDGKSI